ncbi:MAG: hypothetical protein QOF53_3706 [Nocardioidaceae bacterium]|nr:hypothetical protein [Nocardioidaceae bacterium]
MSTGTAVRDTGGYVPPKQSKRGQIFDSVFILALLFAVLFGVTYYSNSAAAPTTSSVKPLSQLPITQTERQQYQAAIDEGLVDLKGVNDQVAASTAKSGSKQYPISPLALLLTFGVIGAYLLFVYIASFREYREVIHERFGPPVDVPSSPSGRGSA